jgi:phage terminase small subunit
MAGVKGKSGGPRQNAGGARPGAGRKPKVPAEKSANQPVMAASAPVVPPADAKPMDMLEMLQAVALGHIEATATQVRAAVAAVQYTHTKKGDGGKKDAAADAAKAASAGRFGSPPPPPRVVANNK